MQRQVLLLLTLFIVCLNAAAQNNRKNPFAVYPRDRIIRPIDDDRRVPLPGNLNPMARAEFRVGSVPSDFRMDRMMLVLKPDADQQAALDNLVAAQQDPNSPYYHQWLTPERYGELFGASETDLGLIKNWLQSHGMKVDEVPAGRRAIVLSGTAAQVNAAFGARIQTYKVDGEVHHANENDPEIPQAMANVVGGLVSLHDFRSRTLHHVVKQGDWKPKLSSGSSHYLTPGDFATIYNLVPLYQQSLDGTGQSIAIVGRSNLKLSDVRTFRSSFGLPPRDPQIIVNGPDPGVFDQNEESEAVLDVEWSGAVAKNANIKFVVSSSTNSTDGVYLSAQYIVSHNVAPVMSVSFGLCEAALGTSGNNFLNNLWQQAAAQGVTVLVSSGDSGAAGCDSASANRGTQGRGINGLCSTPYSVCVGGTQFNDTANPGLYWASSNETGTQASAISYIPENVWNESAGSGLWSGGGGASIVYSKPSWQSGAGVPSDGKRDVPDVSLTAAVHDGYLVYMEGGLMLMGGTSAAAPSLAGILALAAQQTGSSLGNANAVFYRLAANQQSGGATVFHDITGGNNSVPGVTGYNAGTGYDMATGLGSVDANLLVTHWSDASSPPPSFELNASASSLSLAAGASSGLNVNVGAGTGMNASVNLSVSGLPAGVTANFSPGTIAAPGSGSSALTLTAAISAKAGTYAVTISAAGNGTTKAASVTLTVTTSATFTLAASANSITILPGKNGSVTFTTAISSVFKSAVSLSVKGQPAGVTSAFSPASIASPGSGPSKLTVTAASSAGPGVYSLTITAAGGGITQTATLTLNVPGLTFSVTPSTVSAGAGGKPTVSLTTSVAGGLNPAVSLSISGMPTGVTARFSPSSIAAPGSGSSTLTLTRGASAKVGSYKLTLTASGGGISKTATVTLNVTK